MTPEINRRKLLSAGSVAAAVGLAGCGGILADGRGVPGTTDPPADDGSGNGNGNGNGTPEGIPQNVHEYLVENEANLYEEEMIDMTGESQVTVMAGAGSGFAFDPTLIHIDSGTEVTWEWTGEGGIHNVVSAESSATEFRSGDPIDEEGHTWSNTFEEAGNQFYFCNPHKSAGMHAAIVVGEISSGEDA